MLTNLLENRDRKVRNILTLGDTLGRALRENVELFSIEKNLVTYITESGKVIQGSFSDTNKLTLSEIKIESTEIFKDPKRFDLFIKGRMLEFTNALIHGDYQSQNTSFDSVLSLWETRSHFNRIERRLQEKVEKATAQYRILETEEYKKLEETSGQLRDFLKENKDKLVKYTDIKNAAKLSNVISKAFDIPKITVDCLAESKTFSAAKSEGKGVYDLICKQELIRKELMEARRDFDDIWATNEKISSLIGEMYSTNDTQLVKKIEEIIVEIPYFAIASTKQLKNIFLNAVSINESLSIPDKDISTFVTRLFEAKKPYKELIIYTLNEKYGINVLTLKDTPSFVNLANTQCILFEALSKLIPKTSVLKNVLSEVSKVIKGKAGVECLDVNEFICELFKSSGFSEMLSEGSMTRYIDFNRVAADLGQIGDVLRSLMGSQSGGMQNPQMGAPAANPAMGMNGGGPAMPNKPIPPPSEEMYPSDETLPSGQPGPGGDVNAPPPSTNPNVAAKAAQGEVAQEVGMNQTGGETGQDQPPMQEMPQEELISQIQALVADIQSALGGGGDQMGGQEDPSLEAGNELGGEMEKGAPQGQEEGPVDGEEVPPEGEEVSVDELPGKEDSGEEEEAPPKEKAPKKGGFPPKKKDQSSKFPKK